MKHFTNRIIAALLALVTLVVAVPSEAFAAEGDVRGESTSVESTAGNITTNQTPEYLEMDEKNAENVERIKKYLAVNGAKA